LNQKELLQIRRFVGPVTASQLKYIECAVNETVGIFIPTVGQCGYAVTPRHTHPSYSIIIAFEPDSPVAPIGIKLQRNEYGFSVMSPDIPHEEEPLDVFTRFVAVMIDISTFETIWSDYTNKECGPFCWTPFTVNQSVMIHIKEFIAEYQAKTPGTGDILHALGTCIIHKLIRSMLKTDVSVDGISLRLEIQRAIEIMHAKFGEKISVPMLARKVNCSESHFSRLFKQETGFSPAEYFIKVRIDKARKLLSQTDKNATEIAFECGFSSTSHFSDTFHKIVGINPLQYRKNIS